MQHLDPLNCKQISKFSSPYLTAADDVYSGGTPEEAEELNLPLLSTAMSGGLFHPNCRHHLSVYYPGTQNDDGDPRQPTYENPPGTQEHHYLQNQIQRERRLIAGSLDENNIREHKQKEQQLIREDEKYKGMTESEKIFDFINTHDILQKWKPTQGSIYNSSIDLGKYSIKGIEYIVDNKKVVLDYSRREKEIGDLLASKYGKKVQIVPRINYPEGISTPDYLIDGVGYDLKTINGNSRNTLYNAIKGKKKQANNFIFDISKKSLLNDEIDEQIRNIFMSNHTKFVNEIIVIRNGEVIKAYKK